MCELIIVWKEIVEAAVGSQGENGFLSTNRGPGWARKGALFKGQLAAIFMELV